MGSTPDPPDLKRQYKPTDPNPSWTDDGFKTTVGVNYLGHYFLVNLLLDNLSRARGARVCIVGFVTVKRSWNKSGCKIARRRPMNDWGR